jgi:hypothetical protein
MYLLMGTRHSFSISGLHTGICSSSASPFARGLHFLGHGTGLDLPLGSVHVFGFGLWIGFWPGFGLGGRYERAGWLLDYTLATVFDVACWADGDTGIRGEGLSVICV